MSEIDDKYVMLGGRHSRLGDPTGPEQTASAGRSLVRHYENGSIHWSKSSGAHAIPKPIFSLWMSQDGDRGPLGLPLSDDINHADGQSVVVYFQGGSIFCSSDAEAVVRPDILQYFKVHAIALAGRRERIENYFEAASAVFLPYGIDVKLVSFDFLNLPGLADLEIGGCQAGILTSEMRVLFDLRRGVGAGEIAAYFVRTTDKPSNGCGVCPVDRPGVVVVMGADKWSLAHELGHLVGLQHVSNKKRLMYENGTAKTILPPPDLSSGEVALIKNSGLVQPCEV